MSRNNTASTDSFISLSLRASTLKKMLSGENLYLSDIHCSNKRSKIAIQKLLLQAVSEGE